MKNIISKPYLTLLAGFGLAILIFCLPKTISTKNRGEIPESNTFTLDSVLAPLLKTLPSDKSQKILTKISIFTSGQADLNDLDSLVSFWVTLIKVPVLENYFKAERAKKIKSFANLKYHNDFLTSSLFSIKNSKVKSWFAEQIRDNYSILLQKKPTSDSLKIGKEFCEIIGNISPNPMANITKLVMISEKKPNNLYAQYCLGLASMMTYQWDKAISRFNRILEKEPENKEVLFYLASAYSFTKQNSQALEILRKLKSISHDNRTLQAEIDSQIENLKKQQS